jgi:Reverse transcriptase (RNA-dependent DNA polymerase)
MEQTAKYKTFIDKGVGGKDPDGYKRIQCHMIYDVKHDGRHKKCFVVGGYLADPNTEGVYSGMLSFCGIQLITFLGELNKHALGGADIGNAYLEARTKEQVYIIGGPESRTLKGHTLQIDKALYGLRSSGLCWHQRFADVLRDLWFSPCNAEKDV